MTEQATPEVEPAKEPDQGIVIYTDGGCRPNPGYGGWGMHGYLYSTAAPKKGSGNQDFVLTSQGYILKTSYAEDQAKDPKKYNRSYTAEVTPISYVDGHGSFAYEVSNNIAELSAAIQGLIYAEQYDVKTVRMFTDSEHVVKGLSGWADKWRDNGWRKNDGNPPANVEIWKNLVEIRDRIISRGVDLKIEWVEGHPEQQETEGYLGNTLVDKLATLAVMYAKAGINRNDITTTVADGYWKYVPDKHPFIANRRLYFNTFSEYLSPGEYYLGEHDKDDNMLGKRISDGAYAVVKLATPDPLIEMVRNYTSKKANNIDTLVMLRVDQLFKPATHKELSTHGPISLLQSERSLSMDCLDRQPLTLELKPARIAFRAIEATAEMSMKLIAFLKDDPKIISTDLTSILYETEVKIDKKKNATTTLRLRPEFNVGYAALKDVETKYLNEDGSIGTTPVTLSLGIDILDRNSLKRLEEMNPRVTLITWMESPYAFRYATVIEAGLDKGIWCGWYSNLHLITSAETKEKRKKKKEAK